MHFGKLLTVGPDVFRGFWKKAKMEWSIGHMEVILEMYRMTWTFASMDLFGQIALLTLLFKVNSLKPLFGSAYSLKSPDWCSVWLLFFIKVSSPLYISLDKVTQRFLFGRGETCISAHWNVDEGWCARGNFLQDKNIERIIIIFFALHHVTIASNWTHTSLPIVKNWTRCKVQLLHLSILPCTSYSCGTYFLVRKWLLML